MSQELTLLLAKMLLFVPVAREVGMLVMVVPPYMSITLAPLTVTHCMVVIIISSPWAPATLSITINNANITTS